MELYPTLSHMMRSPERARIPQLNEQSSFSTSLSASPSREDSNFLPVIKARRYNLLKLNELRQHREKDKRMGRLQSTLARYKQIEEEEELLLHRSQYYIQQRTEKNRKVMNTSFINMGEVMRQKKRYLSIDK